MKILFDKTNFTKWFVTKSGDIYSETTYQGKSGLFKKHIQRSKRGYLYVRTSNGNYQVHRLVASAFLKNKENKPCVNHKDGNRRNNHVSNLEWVTHKENTQHAIKNGLIVMMKKNEGNLKYTNSQCEDVIRAVNKGETYINAGKIHGMPYSTVAHLIRGSRRKI